MATADLQATIDAYFDAINSERYADVAALFAEDGVMRAPGVEPRRGHEELESYYRTTLRRYPRHHDQPTRVIIAEGTATVEIHYSGALESGAEVEFDAVDLFDFDEQGKIVQLSTWYDSHGVRQQLRAARDAADRSS